MSDDEGGATAKDDTRVAWIVTRIASALKLKDEAAAKAVAGDVSEKAVSDFLDLSDVKGLFVMDGKCSNLPPQEVKKKVLFFTKFTGCVDADRIDEQVAFSDCQDGALEHFLTVAQEVYYPLLTNAENQKGWPEVISRELTDSLHKFLANIYVTIGLSKGKTLLPLPPSESVGSAVQQRDKDRVHILESAVVTWTRQIKNVLKTDPEAALKAGLIPGPLTEIDFWTSKAANLNSIAVQLDGEKIRKVIKMLDTAKSTYYLPFSRLIKDVQTMRTEANENVLFLEPLRKWFDRLSAGDDFEALRGIFRPIMSIILLIWKKSNFYNTAPRLVVIMREICNDVIRQACGFVNGEEIFDIEPNEAVDRLKKTLQICYQFKNAYFDYKGKASAECTSNPWRFQNSALFARLDSFLERCHDVLDLMSTIFQFNKLEKVEIGGTKGKTLTTSVRQIYTDFQTAVKTFQEASYDIMDVEAKEFDDDFYEFRCQINELERRLGSVVNQAFEDCTTVFGAFKLLDSFEGLLERDIIQADLEQTNVKLLNTYNESLRRIAKLFQKGRDDPLDAQDKEDFPGINLPPKSGSIYWAHHLLERVEGPMEKLKAMGKACLELDEGKDVVRAYTDLRKRIKAYETEKITEWNAEVEVTSNEKLKQPLLVRDENGLIDVNFDLALVRLLREVKYFDFLGVPIPESAAAIHKRGEIYRQQTGNLDLIVKTYNNVMETLLDVERPLLAAKMQNIDKILAKGLKHLNWNSHNVNEFIQQTMSAVNEAAKVLQTIKSNVQSIRSILSSAADNLLFERKASSKCYEIDEFLEESRALLTTRYSEIKEGGEQVHKLVLNSNKVLKVSKGAPSWKAYVDYINAIVIDGYENAVLASLRYVRAQVDPAQIAQHDLAPLLEVKLELIAPDILYSPELNESSSGNGLRDILYKGLVKFMNISTLLKRLDAPEGDYLLDIQESTSIRCCIGQISRIVRENEKLCAEFRDTFSQFSYLWVDDLQASFDAFIENEREEGSAMPSLEKFDGMISKYKSLQEDIQALPATSKIGWLKVDARPIKQALGTWGTKWTFTYQKFLLDHVVDSVDELYAFMDNVLATLGLKVEGEDLADGEEPPEPGTLLKVMGCIRDVRKRSKATDAAFEPLHLTIDLLGKYNITVSQQTAELLDGAPQKWEGCKKKTLQARERLSDIQSREAAKLKSRVGELDERVKGFRAHWLENMPFEFSGNGKTAEDEVDAAFSKMDRAVNGVGQADDIPYGSCTDITKTADDMLELQDLFDLSVSDHIKRAVTTCTDEASWMKEIWDMISMVMAQTNEWNLTLWDDINVEFLTDGAKELLKGVKTLNVRVKTWKAYKALEDALKAMMTSLPLVEELHHPSMRERHWKQLMRTTGKTFVMDENFKLENLLALELHKFSDDVTEIVDRAQKELIIEKQLKKIDETWVSLSFEFEPFEENPEISLLVVVEDITLALEDNIVLLQNMQASKYVQGNQQFLEEVTKWQRRLGSVDNVIMLWNEVQGKWTNLQSIFIGSADIRVQLPEESKRFDGVHAQWIEFMRDAVNTINCVEACNIEGRAEMLEGMLGEMEKCEKALADYLEKKRVAFPRFYFTSPSDLIDILSKGSNPQLILKHLPKVVEAVKNLAFVKDKNDEPTKSAIGMHGSDEYVPFPKPFLCEGAVETWLGGLLDATHGTLESIMRQAYSEYEEKPRTKWLFDFCAQLMITVTRTIFTEQVHDAFAQQEDGNENSMRDLVETLNAQLLDLNGLILGELSKSDRRKIITLVTIDVHARDLLQKLIDDRCETPECFQWMSQLRFYMDPNEHKVRIKICDWDWFYQYEYVGNTGCLVITPLTDRCYITLTQASRLCLGGAPAGPAGTGKTETTKDLARGVGIMCYVFNCSDQMDYKTMGNIYKGLAQTGTWGCFDEFNRIPVSVLSVCSTQYKCVLDAIRSKKDRFTFEDEEYTLLNGSTQATVLAFITMNPGYAGRAELPESLKVLFRPCAMVVPNMHMICEIMLAAEGFSMSRMLSRKFMILYELCEDLLSKQRHYDFKLRAVKTTLNVAGGMKRADPDMTEDKTLLRALRDFNVGKLVDADYGIFFGLLEDLFPNTLDQVPRAIDHAFEETITKASKTLNFQCEDQFRLKVTQLREIVDVRWSVFLLGPAGCGKSTLLSTLCEAENQFGEKTRKIPINPKAVTRNELYGYITEATREWKDGVISQIFRDCSNSEAYDYQYLVLDGDIDAEWIESMNTVMDDNKMLTLASNERIPLTNSMKLILEIGDMKHASPATVSRGGCIYVSPTDVGWMPYVQSWLERRENDGERSALLKMFTNSMPKVLDYISRQCKTIVPIPQMAQVHGTCYILEGLLGETEKHAEVNTVLLEANFCIATVWACGGALLRSKTSDFVGEFSKWFKDMTKETMKVRFPDGGDVFDYWVDAASEGNPTWFAHWNEKVESYTHVPGTIFGNISVPTMDSTRLGFFQSNLMSNAHGVMFVGNAGTGKTTLMKEAIRNLDPEIFLPVSMNLNCYSVSLDLQTSIEAPLEKKTGRVYGPPGSKKLVYFIDDLNMPKVDKYDTQAAIAFLRQLIDYEQVYDRVKLQPKEIHGFQMLAAMNPTAGSFFIQPRCQRHYTTFGVQMPQAEVMKSIYLAIAKGHFANFDPNVSALAEKMTDASVELLQETSSIFLPTAVKFHYQFNLRDISNVFQGLLNADPDYYTSPVQTTRLWFHESERVYSDRMVTEEDQERFGNILGNVTSKYFEDLDQDKVRERPIIFTSFHTPSVDDEALGPYLPITEMPKLNKVLVKKLDEYNETNPVMDLVLFDQAMEHVTRIARVISQPRGNIMLVGVGGSGKQSLARLASFICGYQPYQITITGMYSMKDFKENLQGLYALAGKKGVGVSFIFTDGQIVDERMLVYFNDFLASGNIPDIFTREEKDDLCGSVRNEVKQAGMMDSFENCWEFFIEKVRKYLHVCLCVSPVGDALRRRARQFPALINCTVIDWFHAWPNDALVAVAQRFLTDIPEMEDEIKENIAHNMAFTHLSSTEACVEFLQRERRFNYTTPKSFLELIDFYKKLLTRKRGEVEAMKDRLGSGLDKLKAVSVQVADMQQTLKQDMVIVEEKKTATDALLKQVGEETNIVDDEKEKANMEGEKASVIKKESEEIEKDALAELAAAEPAVQAAEEALNSLDKKALTELKAFGSPAAEIVDVMGAVMILMAPGGKIPKDLSWNSGKKLMTSVDKFLEALVNFDKDNLPVKCCDEVEKKYLKTATPLDPAVVKGKSSAAGGLCAWVVNVCKYFRIYQTVKPKRDELSEAQKKLAAATKKLNAAEKHVADLEAKLAGLTKTFQDATADKNAAIKQAESTQQRADLADRLINGLADENVRWTQSLERLAVQRVSLIGDSLLAASFVSYIGTFSSGFRTNLVENRWVPDLEERQLPMTEGIRPMDVLTDSSEMASWANEGLQSDPVSLENGAIVSNCSRWPLLIDPQLQGIAWIRNREEPNGLKIIQQTTHRYLDIIEQAIINGNPVMLENLGEDIDAVLEPVLQRATFRKGRQILIKLGDKDVEYDPNFRFFLQTKLSNPHYKPEIAAQTTILNFMVTQSGLEDQLLSRVVKFERSDLDEKYSDLIHQQNEFKVTLKKLEDDLLFRLSNAEGDILGDVDLIENLENTKKVAKEIEEKVEVAKATEKEINESREVYRPVAIRGAIQYFLMDQIYGLNHFYRYSMANFVKILEKGMGLTEANDSLSKRIDNLVDCTCFTAFSFVSQGLFERHKVIYSVQLCMRILARQGELETEQFEFLVRGPRATGTDNPVESWLADSAWQSIVALSEIEGYDSLPGDLEANWKRFKEWCELERPEEISLPGEWKRLPEFQKLLVIRCLRPDRMVEAMSAFVRTVMGTKYVSSVPFNLARSFEDAAADVPVFIVLSPGVDVMTDIETLATENGMTYENGKLFNVSLGQGQEPIAEKAYLTAHKHGGYVVLQNIHLTPEWTSGFLEKAVDKIGEGVNPDFRLFMSAEPTDAMPINVLQTSVKLTNEPPEGLRPNLLKAWNGFDDSSFESSSKPTELKAISFALSFFHAVLLERKKFGSIGFNMVYPFNMGDLLNSSQLADSYLEVNPKIPWDDLKYLFGEIIYGGHVVDNWDRRMVSAYLDQYMKEDLIEGFELYPDFRTPPNVLQHKGYLEYLEENMPAESPVAYGLHPNAEIGFRLNQADEMFRAIEDLQPSGGGGDGDMSLPDRAKMVLDDILEKTPDLFDFEDLVERVEERTPYTNVFLQEIERMNLLLGEIKRSLQELDLGLSGALTMSDAMETLMTSLYSDRIPPSWMNLAYPSLRPLGSWLHNLLQRAVQLSTWTGDMALPKVTWLSGLFNPQSFLTAVMQTTARRNEWPLDKMAVVTDVSKKQVEDIDNPSREGAFIHGLFLEGARWDEKSGNLDESRPKELFDLLPVVLIKAVTADKASNIRDAYMCPVYKVQKRKWSPTEGFVFTAQLRTKQPKDKWVLAGVAALLDVV